MSYDLCFPNVRHYLQSQEVNIYEIVYEEKHIIFRQKWCFYLLFFFGVGGGGGEWQLKKMGFDSPHYSCKYKISKLHFILINVLYQQNI